MSVQTRQQRTSMRHLSRLTDDRGIFEHALGEHPRFTHGYCTDDNARLLIVAVRGNSHEPESEILARVAARFLLDALQPDGRMHNRMSFERMWEDEPSAADCWGRAMWAFGAAVKRSSDTELRNRCYEAFGIGAKAHPRDLRSKCFAVLGAADILSIDALHEGALGIMFEASAALHALSTGSNEWPWPEKRLAYANAVIPDAMVACGHALGDEQLATRGLMLLRWLIELQTDDEHLSVVPTGGLGFGEGLGQFDQQPIEVSTIASAAERALSLTGDEYWKSVIEMCASWFLGNNDSGFSMIDLDSGGGYDGLERFGVNVNQGAESTLAMLSTMQINSSTWLV